MAGQARRRKRRGRQGTQASEPVVCPFCGREVPFCWTCRHCGFRICQKCMDDNLKMMTCNNVTWWCADCGESNGY